MAVARLPGSVKRKPRPEPEKISSRPVFSRFNDSQRRIAALVMKGLRTSQISPLVGMSKNTINTMIGGMLQTAGAESRLHMAVLLAWELNVIS
jgi:DNA-binding NarL/FixJ family response regulator